MYFYNNDKIINRNIDWNGDIAMKFIDQEDKEKLHDLGLKIQQMKVLSQDIYDFFIKDG